MLIESVPDNITTAILWALCGLVVTMGGALVWVIKNRKFGDNKREQTSGELPTAYWEKHFERIEKTICNSQDEIAERVDSAREELINAVRDLTKAINDLTMTLLRGK